MEEIHRDCSCRAIHNEDETGVYFGQIGRVPVAYLGHTALVQFRKKKEIGGILIYIRTLPI